MSTEDTITVMETAAVIPAVEPVKTTKKQRGRNDQRSPRRYRAHPTPSMNRRVKKFTELFKSITGAARLTSEDRDMIVYLSTPLNRSTEQES